jgi:hypothetical protein
VPCRAILSARPAPRFSRSLPLSRRGAGQRWRWRAVSEWSGERGAAREGGRGRSRV